LFTTKPEKREGCGRKLLKEKLSVLGQTCEFKASNGKEAIEITKKQKPDLILLDIVLPDISGEAAFRGLLKACVRGKVIMVTTVG
jgi:two-component system chemotaxis response regulator CheY